MYASHVVVQREFPRGFATRGWNPQNPVGRTNAFDVPELTGDDELARRACIVWQGQIMSVAADGKTWVKGVPLAEGADRNDPANFPTIVAIANNDQLDDDVRNAGTLVGLSCSGQYTYATPYFAHTDPTKNGGVDDQYSYKAGTYLTYCTNDEVDSYDYIYNSTVVTDSTHRSLAGFVRPAQPGELVIGRVSQTGYGPYSTNPVTKVTDPDAAGRGFITEGLNRNAIPFKDTYRMPSGVWALQSSIGTAVDSTSKINNAYMLVFETMHTGFVMPGATEDPGSDTGSDTGSGEGK